MVSVLDKTILKQYTCIQSSVDTQLHTTAVSQTAIHFRSGTAVTVPDRDYIVNT